MDFGGESPKPVLLACSEPSRTTTTRPGTPGEKKVRSVATTDSSLPIFSHCCQVTRKASKASPGERKPCFGVAVRGRFGP